MSTLGPPASAAAPSEISRVLGRYVLRQRIAAGGMGEVWLAELTGTDAFQKRVAVKTIHTHVASEPRFVRMFLDEARLVAQIDHPNVCAVFDFGCVDGTYYLAMEYLQGAALSALA